jgi:hypothetical protein
MRRLRKYLELASPTNLTAKSRKTHHQILLNLIQEEKEH